MLKSTARSTLQMLRFYALLRLAAELLDVATQRGEVHVGASPQRSIYYARHDRVVVVLLCAGDKRTQAYDIETAVTYWTDYLRRLT